MLVSREQITRQRSADRARGIRGKFNRTRKGLRYQVGSVVTDGRGDILDRPQTRGLPCFGDPIEFLFGLFDQPRTWGDKEPEPKGCALCPVRMHCSHVVDERLESTPKVHGLYNQWQKATCAQKHEDRFVHPTWAPLAIACDQAGWTDKNDDNLRELEEEKIAEKLREAAERSAKKRQAERTPKKVPSRILEEIQAYRDARVSEMLEAKKDSKPPLWIRNRTEERCILVADAWQARETLDRENRKSSAARVHSWLVDKGRLDANGPSAIIQRVGDALRKGEDLIADGIWPFFDPEAQAAVAPPGAGMHPSAVYKLLEK
ncbi:hypothetical protein BPTFM16_01835 [Altererythrobacter insulae]|nr:hypothetical protein BPTFM16_01835 [Altererythrobacter insulae]